MSAILAALLAVTGAAPALARDGTVAPPTCVSILNAAQNCPPRPSKGSARNAEVRLKAAEAQLEAAEKKAGGKLEPGQSQGEPELVAFWEAEGRRLGMTKDYLKGLRTELLQGSEEASLRWLSRLTILAPDVEKEVSFWCEAVGMQRYLDLPGGGAVVAFGPPVLDEGDEGGFFGIEIRPAMPTGASAGTTLGSAKLSFVQVATPSLIRISKVVGTGGQLTDGYGYYNIRSPAGVDVRAYVDDRRDPVELVALAAPEGDAVKEMGQALEALGLQPAGPYKNVCPETQSYMPEHPPGNVLYTSTAGGGAKQTVQVLLLPILKEVKKSPFGELPKGPTLIMDENSQYSLDVLEQEEIPQVTLSPVGGASLTVLAPAGASTKLAAGAGTGTGTGSGAGGGVRVFLSNAKG